MALVWARTSMYDFFGLVPKSIYCFGSSFSHADYSYLWTPCGTTPISMHNCDRLDSVALDTESGVTQLHIFF